MIYLIMITAAFLPDFFINRRIDEKMKIGERRPAFHNKIIFEKYYNKGAALNLLADKPKLMRMIHTILLLFICAVCYLSTRVTGREAGKAGLALIAGGGLNNLTDRYAKGHVVDYVRFRFGPKRLQKIVFNLSDFFIFIGAVLTVIGYGDERQG